MPARRSILAFVPLSLFLAARVFAYPCGPSDERDLSRLAIEGGVTQLLSGDVNGDGRPDLLLVRGAAGSVQTKLHVEGVEFAEGPGFTWTAPIVRVVAADLDADGKLDLAFTDDQSHAVIRRGQGDGSFALHASLVLPYAGFDIVVGDLDSRGALELVVSHPTAGRITTLLSTLGFTYSLVTTDVSTFAPDACWLALGKFSDDVYVDLAVSRRNNSRLWFFRGQGSLGLANGSFAASTSLLLASPPTCLDVGDLDLDGRPDMVIGTEHRTEWMYGQGGVSPSFVSGSGVAMDGSSIADLLVADANDDQLPDLLCARQVSGVISLIRGNGGRSLSFARSYAVDGQPISVVPALLGGSPSMDFVTASAGATDLDLLVSHCIPLRGDPTIDPPVPDVTAVPPPPPPPPPDPGPSPNASAWPIAGISLCDAPGAQSEVCGIDDFAHGAYFGWVDERAGQKDIYVTRVDAFGNRPAGWDPNGNPVCTAPGNQYALALVPDGAHGVFVTWIDARESTLGIYVQKLTPDGQVAAGWPANGRRICSGWQDSYAAFPDRMGGLKLSWVTFELGGLRVRAQHLRPDGTPHPDWGECGVALALPSGSDQCSSWGSYYFNSAPDWLGGVLVSTAFWGACGPCHGCSYAYSMAIHDLRPSGGVSSTFGLDWRSVFVYSDGLGGRYYRSDLDDMIRDGAGFNPSWQVELPSNISCVVQPDGSGGFHVLWLSPTDLRAARLENDGNWNPVWGGFGGVVAGGTPTAASRYLPVTTSSGGAFIVWQDSRNQSITGTDELRATWIQPDGSLGAAWPADGRGFGVQPVAQEMGAVVGNRIDAAIVGWRDQRAGDWDVYAYRLTTDPSLVLQRPRAFATGTSTSTHIARLDLVGPTPNPSSALSRVELILPAAGDATLRVYDVSGRRIEEQRFVGLSPGAHTVMISPQAKLTPGLYLLELEAAGTRMTRRMVITR